MYIYNNMNSQMQNYYVPMQYKPKQLNDFDPSVLNIVALVWGGLSIVFIGVLWGTTVNPPTSFFAVYISWIGLLWIYSLISRWADAGCWRGFVKIFAWMAIAVAVLVGFYIFYMILWTGFDLTNQTLILAYIILVGK